jgi:hypothetical protein
MLRLNIDMTTSIINQNTSEMSSTDLTNELREFENKVATLKAAKILDRNAIGKHEALIKQIQIALTTKAHNALMSQIEIYKASSICDDDLSKAAEELATTFKCDYSAHGQSALTMACKVLQNNTAENRNEFLDVIDVERKEKKKTLAIAILSTFFHLAVAAALITMTALGILPAPAAVFMCAFFGTMALLGVIAGVGLIRVSTKRAWGDNETSLVTFGDRMIVDANKKQANASVAKISVFSTKKENAVKAAGNEKNQLKIN